MSKDLQQTIAALMQSGIKPTTQRAHARDLRYFNAWPGRSRQRP